MSLVGYQKPYVNPGLDFYKKRVPGFVREFQGTALLWALNRLFWLFWRLSLSYLLFVNRVIYSSFIVSLNTVKPCKCKYIFKLCSSVERGKTPRFLSINLYKTEKYWTFELSTNLSHFYNKCMWSTTPVLFPNDPSAGVRMIKLMNYSSGCLSSAYL